jgi:hypothetical protein
MYLRGGNVGIGTTNPGYKLDVAGSFRVNGGYTSTFGNDGLLHINSRSTTHGSETVALQTTIDGRALTESNPGTHGGESRNVLALQPDGGYVGIGTASPDGRLHICSGTSGDCHLILHADTDNNNETDNPKIMFRQDGAIYTAEIGIDNSGNKLAIRGTSGIAFYDGGTSSTDINHLESTSTERMRIEAGGNVGIGTASPGYKLHVNGDIYATGNITGYSDKRAKSDIQKIENALDKIDKLNGYTFTMNDKRYTGVIAQEVLPVLPEAVTGSEETHYAVAYGNMMGLIIEAIKELKKKIEQ